MPYGLVNFAAGLTSVSFKDYLLGTILGTVPSVLPFVLLGSSGIRAIKTGNFWPLLLALALTGIVVGGSTCQQHRNRRAETSSPSHSLIYPLRKSRSKTYQKRDSAFRCVKTKSGKGFGISPFYTRRWKPCCD